jgi:hypothetical protein
LGSRWGLQEGQRAYLARQPEDLEAELVADRDLMVAVAVVFATCAISGFRSFQECEDGAGGDAAFAGLADVTSRVSLMP